MKKVILLALLLTGKAYAEPSQEEVVDFLTKGVKECASMDAPGGEYYMCGVGDKVCYIYNTSTPKAPVLICVNTAEAIALSSYLKLQ